MRTTFHTIAALAVLFSILIGCKPDEIITPDNPEEQKSDPEPAPIEPTPVITIDGKFADWSCEDAVSDNHTGAYTILSEIKGYCDADNLYLYYKTKNITQIHNLRVMVDTDGEMSTGTPGSTGTYIVSCGYSLMINITNAKNAGDAACYSDMYGGDTMVGSVKIKTKSLVAEDNSAEVEMALDRESLEKLAPFEERYVRLCMFALSPSWEVCASIPSPDDTEEPLIVKVNN